MLTGCKQSLLISVDDLRRLIEKAGGQFRSKVYSESVTFVASLAEVRNISAALIKAVLFNLNV